MRIDCFPFFNEVSLLKARLQYLQPVVDLFIISELDRTHSNQPKPYYLDQVDLPDNVIRIRMRTPVDHLEPIQLDRVQRDIITEFIPPGEHQIFHGDLDEFPPRELFQFQPNQPLHILQDLYYYDLHHKSSELWTLPLYTPQLFKPSYQRHHPYPVVKAGWHLSWFGGPKQRLHKLKSFAHQELNTPRAQLLAQQPQGDLFERPHIQITQERAQVPQELYDALYHYLGNSINNVGEEAKGVVEIT